MMGVSGSSLAIGVGGSSAVGDSENMSAIIGFVLQVFVGVRNGAGWIEDRMGSSSSSSSSDRCSWL